MANFYTGGCSCGAVQVELELPKALETYAPRQCDCDFCEEHDGAYISDPDGRLVVRCGKPIREEKQGSNTASMNF